jgi:hypothetical protein
LTFHYTYAKIDKLHCPYLAKNLQIERSECTLLATILDFGKAYLSRRNSSYRLLANRFAAIVGLEAGGHLYIHEYNLQTNTIVAPGNIRIRGYNDRIASIRPPLFPTWIVYKAAEQGLAITFDETQTVVGVLVDDFTVMVINYLDYGNSPTKSLGFCARMAEAIA